MADKDLTEKDLADVDAEIETLMDEMVKFSEESANPEAAELYEYVFSESTAGDLA